MTDQFNGIVEALDIRICKSGILAETNFVAKDLFDVAGYVTGAGNPDWKRTHPAAEKNASAVQALVNAGAHLIGKSCTDELAFSLDGINAHYGTPVNPNQAGCIPGGSSSGSASAVAASLCDFAIGTDTAGSVRVPSAYCGIYGFRPSHGRISASGVVPLGPSFDTVGWMARSPEILAKVGRVLLSETNSDSVLPPNMVLVRDSMELLDEQFREPFMRACERLFSLKNPGTISLPNNALEQWSALFGTIRSYEAWKQHGEWLQQTNPKMAEAIKERFLACGKVTQAECEQSREERQKVLSYLNELLSDSVLCVPVVCSWAPKANASEELLSRNRRKNLLLNSIASFGGLPQLVIPITIPNEQRKFAISLIAAAGKDAALLEFAELRNSNF